MCGHISRSYCIDLFVSRAFWPSALSDGMLSNGQARANISEGALHIFLWPQKFHFFTFSHEGVITKKWSYPARVITLCMLSKKFLKFQNVGQSWCKGDLMIHGWGLSMVKMDGWKPLRWSVKYCQKLSNCWSGHVSSSLWSNFSKVTSLRGHSISKVLSNWVNDKVAYWAVLDS